MSQLVKDLDLKAFHNRGAQRAHVLAMSQLVKDLDLKAFHNGPAINSMDGLMSQLVKDLDLKAFHNADTRVVAALADVTARQRS